jgi:hypothetical protein
MEFWTNEKHVIQQMQTRQIGEMEDVAQFVNQ